MSLILSPTSHVRAGAGQRTNRIKAGLLASACFAATNLVLATGAQANDVLVGGLPAPDASPLFILVTPLNADTVVNVNTTNITGPNIDGIRVIGFAGTQDVTVDLGKSVTGGLNGIYLTGTTGSETATVNGNVTGGVNGVVLNPGFAALSTGGTATLNGTGTIEAGTGYGAWLLNNNAPIIIDGPASITSGLSGIVTQSFGVGPTSIANVGTVSGTAGYGIYSRGVGGDLSIQNTGNVGGITGGVDAINAFMFGGNINIGDVTKNGVITGGVNGIVANTTGVGTITVAADKAVTGTLGYGIWTANVTGDQNITTSGPVTGLLSGLYLNSTSGNIVADGKGTGTTIGTGAASTGVTMGSTGNMTVKNYAAITGVTDGVWLVGTTGTANVLNNGPITATTIDGVLIGTTTGAINVKDNTSITGAYGVVTVGGPTTVDNNGPITGTLGSGVWATTADGAISVNGNGAITGTGAVSNGVLVTSLGGDVNIGNVTTNGVIKGEWYGIYATDLANGNVAINTDMAVTGALVDGIYAASVLGNVDVNIFGDTVQGGTYGVVTATLGGTATTNNLGTIKNINDTGAASDPGLYAYGGLTGINVLNNDGTVIGGIVTGGTSSTINNNAGGTWTPNAVVLANSFGAITDTVNNAGLINIRTGLTTFSGLEAFNNLSGGVIDLTYGGTQATNSLVVGGTFAPLAGSTIIQAFNPVMANNSSFGTDSSSNAKGTADTILASAVAPGAKSTINLTTVGGAAAINGLIGTSGSVALVQGTTFLLDPGKGASAKFVNSAFYTLVGDPSTGAVKFNLTDAADGGVFLQWSPNITAASLGAFGSAVGAATAGGTLGTSSAGGSDPALSKGTALALAAGGLNGVGGFGNSGGPTGGGAAGQVADLAAGGVMSLDSLGSANSGGGGSLKDGGYSGPACPSDGRGSAWAAGDVSSSNSTGGGDGRSNNLAGGVEANVGDAADLGCRRLAVGVFGFTGDSTNSWSTGRDKSSNDGIGAYLRASSAMGLYGSLLGAVSWSDHDLSNLVFNSTANKNATGISGVATIGYVARVGGNASVDLRTYVAYGNVDGDGFTDSQGITVSGSNDDLLTVGASAGVYAPIAPSTQGFVRGGVKWAQVDSSITAFGITQSGTVDEVSGSVESGFVAHTSDGVELGASGFGEFSDSTTSYGGRAHVGVKF
jgi:hypothetical protein